MNGKLFLFQEKGVFTVTRTDLRRKIENLEKKQADVPSSGTSACFFSTGFRKNYESMTFPTISQRKIHNKRETNNLLPKKHYFRRLWAKHPSRNVLLVERQIPDLSLAEVRA